MKMRSENVLFSLLLLLAVQCVTILSASAQQQRVIDLPKLARSGGLQSYSREVVVLEEGSKRGIRVVENPKEGLVWLKDVEFGDGTIEFDIRGKDVFQRSFPGIAFHAVDTNTYDVVYFRPFNFRAEDPVRRSHAVQYMSLPGFDWHRLRQEHPLKYEQPVTMAPDPNDWFHVKIVIKAPQVTVFVNGAKEASLVVEQLSQHRKGLLALWVSHMTGGDFANMTISH